VVSADFPIALRGYDRFAVDAYVERTAQLVAELQATRSPEAAVRRALERVGEEISGILQRAHDTADEITARSRSEAEERLELARHEAVEITAQAELRVKELDAETERIWAERHSIVTDAHDLARRLTELAESALERFPPALTPTEADPVGGIAPETDVEASRHLFDGAVEDSGAAEPAIDEEPTFEQPTEDHLALDQPAEYHIGLNHPTEPLVEEDPALEPQRTDRPKVDQPTESMPPIAPWEADGGPLDAGVA
jgi:hypothetical protein